MKKFICLMLAATLLCGIIAGCTDPTATPAATETGTDEQLEDPDTTNAVSYTHLDVYKRQPVEIEAIAIVLIPHSKDFRSISS